jgi:multidrug resistance efflux pump
VIADAKIEAAAATVALIAARVAKLQVYAPADGAVALLVAEPGEPIVPGQPLITFHEAGQHWASFNSGENHLGGLGIGFPIELTLTDGSAPIG